MRASIHVAPALTSLLLLAACSFEPSGPQLLQDRLTVTMSPEQQCNRMASTQPLPNGARVVIGSDSLFLPGRADLTECGHYAIASAVEAMLDPRIMQVVIEPYGDVSSPSLARDRAERLQAMFSTVGFVPGQPAAIIQPAAAPVPGSWGIVLTFADTRPAAPA